MKDYFVYPQQALDFLKACDAQMAWAIGTFPAPIREIMPDLFSALVYSILGQQISSAAQASVWRKFCLLFPVLTPERIAKAELDCIQAAGMSARKARYIQNAAEKIMAKTPDIYALAEQCDDEVIGALTTLDGVGVWTAEMLMLFSMRRMNILSYGDFGIRKGICRLYGLEQIDKKQFACLKERYTPYASVASLYLWEIASTKNFPALKEKTAEQSSL